MRIAICDDDAHSRAQLASLIAQETQGSEQFYVQQISSGEALLQCMQETPFDLIFMDIEMGEGLSGIETAVQLRQQNRTVMLVFVTAHNHFVFDAFDVQAMQYLLKPVVQSQFQHVFQRCLRKYYDEEERFPFRIRNENGQEELVLLMAKDILYVESYLRKVKVHTVYGWHFEMVGKISEMETLLARRGFIRPHKSYLVNLRYLRLVETEQVVLKSDREGAAVRLPMSRRKREAVKKALLQYKLDDDC